MNILPDHKIRRIRELLQEGLSIRAVARETGCSKVTINSYAWTIPNWVRRGKHRLPNDPRRSNPLEQFAHHHNLSHWHMASWLNASTATISLWYWNGIPESRLTEVSAKLGANFQHLQDQYRYAETGPSVDEPFVRLVWLCNKGYRPAMSAARRFAIFFDPGWQETQLRKARWHQNRAEGKALNESRRILRQCRELLRNQLKEIVKWQRHPN